MSLFGESPNAGIGPAGPAEIVPEARERLIESVARRVVEMGLEMPAVLFLQASKPVTFLASQAVLVGGPVFYPLFGMEQTEGFSAFLSDRGNIEALILRIEDLSREKDKKKKEEKKKSRGE